MEYATTNPPPKDHLQVLATVKYLSALNNIFEKMLLGRKTRIFYAEGRSIQRLDEGFAYFREWADELIARGSFNGGVDSKDFIAWQVHVHVHVHFVVNSGCVCTCLCMCVCMCALYRCTCVHVCRNTACVQFTSNCVYYLSCVCMYI